MLLTGRGLLLQPPPFKPCASDKHAPCKRAYAPIVCVSSGSSAGMDYLGTAVSAGNMRRRRLCRIDAPHQRLLFSFSPPGGSSLKTDLTLPASSHTPNVSAWRIPGTDAHPHTATGANVCRLDSWPRPNRCLAGGGEREMSRCSSPVGLNDV